MGRLLDSFSKSTVETALHTSEMLLLISGFVLLIGIWGEYRKGEKWKRYLAAFQVMVLAGIGVELLADAGVFLFSESLQRLEGADIQALDEKARGASEKATDALGKSITAVDRSETANTISRGALDKSAKAEGSAIGALDLAKGARSEADSFEHDITSAKKQAADAEAHLAESLRQAAEASKEATTARLELDRLRAPRTLSAEQQRKVTESTRAFMGTEFILEVNPIPEAINLAGVITNSLIASGWKWKKIDKFGVPTISVVDNISAVVWYREGLAVAFRPVILSVTPPEFPAVTALAAVLQQQGLGNVQAQTIPEDTNFSYIPTGVAVVIVGSKQQ